MVFPQLADLTDLSLLILRLPIAAVFAQLGALLLVILTTGGGSLVLT